MRIPASLLRQEGADIAILLVLHRRHTSAIRKSRSKIAISPRLFTGDLFTSFFLVFPEAAVRLLERRRGYCPGWHEYSPVSPPSKARLRSGVQRITDVAADRPC